MKTMAEYQREWREKDPQRNRDMQKRYFSSPKGKATVLLSDARQRAKRGGYKCQITKKWLVRKLEAGVCEVTGLPLDFSIPDGYRRGPFSPSLEKVDPKKGYTYKNTKVVVFIHNSAKNEWSLEDVITYAKALLKEVTDE